MSKVSPVTGLAALAHTHRLKIFRLLVRQGPAGLSAGEIGETIGIGAPNTSFHLKELRRANLLRATRDGRFVRYAIHAQGMRQLITYLMNDCRESRPDLCGRAFADAAGAWRPRKRSK